jgi:adenosine deaminase
MNLLELPKVELHRHLECSMRLDTLKELAEQHGIEVPPTNAQVKAKFLVIEPMTDLGAVLQKFLVTQKVLSSPQILTRITRECIEDCAAEGIRILELRYAPTFIQQGHEQMSFQDIHDAIFEGVQQTRHLPIAVGLLLIIQRIFSVATAQDVTAFAIANKDTVLGLDLADNEVGFDSVPFAPCFRKAREAGLHITIHAGEAPSATSSQSVYDAIEKLGATRIGHGVQVYKDPKALDYLKKHRIPLELCPTSNWLTQAVPSVSAHPFRSLMEAGVPVTLNTDDPGIFDINLIHEYEILQKQHAFTEAEFQKINDTAAAASFIPLKEKQRVWPRVIGSV